jgi:hypothetical protein
MNLSNLVSFTFVGLGEGINAGRFRTFLLNNQSLERLSLDRIKFEGSSSQHPVTLSNLKSFSFYHPRDYSLNTLSTLIRVPVFRRLSSILFSVRKDLTEPSWFTLQATGDDVVFTIDCEPNCIVGAWQDLTGYAKPTIQRVRFENPNRINYSGDESGVGAVIALFMDAHTVEIGYGCACFYHGFTCLYPSFLRDLKELGPQVRTVRFEIPEREETCRRSPAFLEDCDPRGERLFDAIQDLVTYRAKWGRPFSSVERMVNSESEKINTESRS